MIFIKYILFASIVDGRRLRHLFCNQHQLENVVRLATTVQQLYETEFTVIDVRRKRRHHSADLNQDVMTFYDSMSNRLTKITNDLSLLSMEQYQIVQTTITVMIELMEEEVLNAGKVLRRQTRTVSQRRAMNLDLVHERTKLSLAKVIESFLSVGAQCMFEHF